MKVAALLAASGLPRSEALLVLAHASGWTRERLLAGSGDVLPATIADTFMALARRRVDGEPIAYLVGRREFYGRVFAVDARVLIPRPETELLVELALRWIDATTMPLRAADLGTGSGVLAITLSLERPSLDVVATDISEAALACARGNAERLNAPVRFVAGDWYAAFDADARFDLIVSNPPYIAAGDPHLSEGDLRFEPVGALTEGSDGLAALRAIVEGARPRLAAAGTLMVEHGYDQAVAVRALMRAAELVDVTSQPDLAGIERVTCGTLPPSRATGHAPAAAVL